MIHQLASDHRPPKAGWSAGQGCLETRLSTRWWSNRQRKLMNASGLSSPLVPKGISTKSLDLQHLLLQTGRIPWSPRSSLGPVQARRSTRLCWNALSKLLQFFGRCLDSWIDSSCLPLGTKAPFLNHAFESWLLLNCTASLIYWFLMIFKLLRLKEKQFNLYQF